MRLLSRRAAGSAAALVLLTACGGSGGASSQAPELTPVAAVQSASAATAQAGSSKVELLSETSAGGQQVRITAKGAVDNAARTGLLTLELPSVAGGGVIEQRILGDVVYMTLPQEPGVFYQLDLAALAGSSFGSSTDPTGGLKALEAVSDDVREVGQEKVRDADTTRYAGSYDLQAAAAALQGPARAQVEQLGQLTGQTSFPFEAWLDDQQRVRKFVQTVELPASEQTGGKPITTTTTLELFDFGTPVEVTAPPAEQVRDGGPLLEGLAGGGST